MIPQRKKVKDYRTDLRLINIALLCSRDHSIPLLHRTYPGNGSDYPLFREEVVWRASLMRAAVLTRASHRRFFLFIGIMPPATFFINAVLHFETDCLLTARC